MPQTKLTATAVEKLRPPRRGQIEYYDRLMPAFGLRVSYKGTKAWFLMTRLGGRLARITLGRYPALSLADARDSARIAIRQVEAGRDPRVIKREADQEAGRRRLNSFAACADEFVERYVAPRLRPSTRREYVRILKGPDTRTLRDRPVAEITKRDVMEVLDHMEQRGSPGAAKRALAYLRKFFNWCAERDILMNPPTDRVAAPHPEVKRDRVLNKEELCYLLKGLEADRSQFAAVVWLLLLTGQRRSEVAGMRWSEIRDMDGDDCLWEIPALRTKNKHAQLVPLIGPAREIVESQPRANNLVFTVTGTSPFSGFGKAKKRLDAWIDKRREQDGRAPLREWRLHDLRRTMVTVMNEELAIAPHVVEAVVNHISGITKAGVAGIYNRALYLVERRRALSEWAKYLSRLEADSAAPTS